MKTNSTGKAWKALIAIIIAMVCVGCKSVEYVEVETIRLDTLHHYELQYDSIVRIDSIYEREYVKGDTVFLEKTKYHFRDKVKMVTDTIVEKAVETKEVPVEVEKKLSVWDKVRIGIADCFLAFVVLVLVGFAIFWVVKKK